MTAPALSLVVCAAPLAERAADVASRLVEARWDVTVLVTPAARSWLDDGSVEAATGRVALCDYRSPGQAKRGPRPTAVVVCPITFNTLNKLAAGISDTYALGVLNEALATGTPVLAVPVVSERLWPHPALIPNLGRLTSAGVTFLDPRTGRPGAHAVRSGTGPKIAADFDPAWLLAYLADTPPA